MTELCFISRYRRKSIGATLRGSPHIGYMRILIQLPMINLRAQSYAEALTCKRANIKAECFPCFPLQGRRIAEILSLKFFSKSLF